MATNQEIYEIMQPQNAIIGRVVVAMTKKCWAILAEDEATTNHANRLALAYKWLQNPKTLTPALWRLFLSNATVQNSFGDLTVLTDNDINYVVSDDTENKIFNYLANMEAS